MENLLEKIVEKSGKSKEEILKLVEGKVEEFSGLLSAEGAMYIIAKEFGISQESEGYKKDVKIENLVSGIRRVDLKVKVVEMSDIREFVRSDGSSGKVKNVLLADDTGVIRLSLWNDQIAKFKFDIGSFIEITNAYCVENSFGACELRLGEKSRINSITESFDVVPITATQTNAITAERLDLIESGKYYEIKGTLTQIFGPSSYKVCEVCGKKVKLSEDSKNYKCEVHGQTNAKECLVLSFIVDDGWSSLRVTAFRELAEKFLSEVEGKKNVIIKARGFAKVNDFSGNLEIISNYLEISEDEEILREMVSENGRES